MLSVFYAVNLTKFCTIKHTDEKQSFIQTSRRLFSTSSNDTNHSMKHVYRTCIHNTRSDHTVIQSLQSHSLPQLTELQAAAASCQLKARQNFSLTLTATWLVLLQNNGTAGNENTKNFTGILMVHNMWWLCGMSKTTGFGWVSWRMRVWGGVCVCGGER